MLNVNGFLCASSRYTKIDRALKLMRHRAWKGIGKRERRGMFFGLCLTEETSTDEDVIIHGEIYSKISLHDDTEKLAKQLSSADGTYSFVQMTDNSLIFCRDPMGTKPLYYAHDGKRTNVSSDARSLSVLGATPISVEPGIIYETKGSSIQRTRFSPIEFKIENHDLSEATDRTEKLLMDAVEQRIKGRKIVLGFGGGIDSTLLAKLASSSDITAVTVCAENSIDSIVGKKSADLLNINHEELIVDDRIVDTLLTELKSLVPLDAMNASIACIVCLLAKFAKDNDFDGIMLGQLADELFGGYARYLRRILESEDSVREEMFRDVRNAHRNNFERDEQASSGYTRLLLPYASIPLVKYAVTVPLEMKLNRDGERKILLRNIGEKLELPAELLNREKKAMQFSSGIYKMVRRRL